MMFIVMYEEIIIPILNSAPEWFGKIIYRLSNLQAYKRKKTRKTNIKCIEVP